MKYISVCIPTYEMHGKGAGFLRFSFDLLVAQTFKDFDIVISDHSKDDAIKDLCETYKNKLDIHYHRKTRFPGNPSSNINKAIRMAQGKLIKILFMDDYLAGPDSLQQIADNFDLTHDHWMVTACEHTIDGTTLIRPFYPKYDDKTILFKNTISSPSVLTIKNEDPLFFDDTIIWYLDTDYYKRCYQWFGAPKILNEINVVNRIGPHQLSNTVANEKMREREFGYIMHKFNVPGTPALKAKYKADRWYRYSKSLVKKALKIKK